MKLIHLAVAAAISLSFNLSANAADRGVAYVSNQDGGITVIDLNTHSAQATIDVKAEGPRGLGISVDGKLLIVATRENGSTSLIDTKTNKTLVRVNPKFYRPAEVELLIGNPEKAKRELGWEPETTLEQLCQMMVEADIRRNEAGFSF